MSMKFQTKKTPDYFGEINSVSLLTRYTSLDNIIEIIKHNKLHFSPLSNFSDLSEGKTLNQIINIENTKSISSEIRSQVFYASCWYNGSESILMWDIYGRKNSIDYLAIQIDFNSIKKILDEGSYRFISNKITIQKKEPLNEIKSDAFKLDTFKCGLIKYDDFDNLVKSNSNFVGRFKSLDFRHENEFRFLVYQNYKSSIIGLDDLKCCFNEESFRNLKFTIIVNPYASEDIFNFVEKGFSEFKNVEVIHSKFKNLLSK
jgi:hypothetical protein